MWKMVNKKKKLRILMLNYEYPPIGGGAGVCTKYQAEGLSKLGYKVTVVSTWFKGEKTNEKKGNLKIIRLRCKREAPHKSSIVEKLAWAKESKKFLKEYCKNHEFDVCITNFTIPGGIVGKFLKKKFKIPYYIISHGHDVPWFLPKEMAKYHIPLYFWIKSICNNCKGLILLTSEMKKNADSFMGKQKNKNIIIPNGCVTKSFYPNFKKKSKKFKIIYIGRFSIQKDPITFFKGIKEFSKHTSDFTINILGNGPLKEQCEDFVKENNLTNNINFLGWVNKDTMLKEYQSANIQVITSLAEAMSIATLESLSSGQYILSTPVSGNTDVIKPNINGDFFAIGDYKELAEKLISYYKNKFKKGYKVPIKEINKIRNKYDWSNIVKMYDDVLKR